MPTAMFLKGERTTKTLQGERMYLRQQARLCCSESLKI